MNATVLAKRLLDNGYVNVGFSIADSKEFKIPGMAMYMHKGEYKKRIVCILDYDKGCPCTGENLVSLREGIVGNNINMEMIYVVFTSDSVKIRQLIAADSNHWIFNMSTQSLEIYDNQPGEFYDLRARIEERGTPIYKKIFTVTNLLVLINVIIYVIMSIKGDTEDAEYLYFNGALSPELFFEEKKYYTIFTSMFMHSGITHIFNNMLVLLILGKNLEDAVGSVKYTIIYLFSGIIGGLTAVLYYNSQVELYYTSVVGASGAIFGVMGAILAVMILNRNRINNIGIRRMSLNIILSIYVGFTNPGVCLAAHLGGLVSGFMIAIMFFSRIFNGKRGSLA